MIDIFGRSGKRRVGGRPGPPGVGFSLNNQGDFDLKQKKITNLKDPNNDQDAVTLAFVKKSLEDRASLKSEDNSLGFHKRRLVDIDSPKNDNDAVNLAHLGKTALCSHDDFFDAKERRIANVRNPSADFDAVNAKIFYTRALCSSEIKNGYGDNEWLYDAKDMRITNLGQSFFSNDAVSGRTLLDSLKLILKLMELELADLALNLRMESLKKPDKNLNSHLNSISGSTDRTWRSALKLEPKIYSLQEVNSANIGTLNTVLDDFVSAKANSARTLKTLSQTFS